MRKYISLFIILLLSACAPKTVVTSPDGRIAVRFSVDESGVPSYCLDVDGAPLVEASEMGLVADAVNLDRGFVLKSSRLREHKETWHQPWGENKEVEDHHRELSLKLMNEAGVGLDPVLTDADGLRSA